MKRGTRRRCAALSAAVTLTILMVACTLETRHKMLVFFFDGVPPLAAPPFEGPTTATLPQPVPFEAVTTSTLGVLPNLEGAERFARRRVADDGKGFSHSNMTTKQCLICHDESKGLEPTVEVSLAFCDKCHQKQRLEEGWNHGVINLGQCLPCHRAGHESPYPYLLDKPASELCLFCHQEENGMDWEPFHKIKGLRIDQNDCAACHDPHRAF